MYQKTHGTVYVSTAPTSFSLHFFHHNQAYVTPWIFCSIQQHLLIHKNCLC